VGRNKKLKGIIMSALRSLLLNGQEDNFCPELFGEWFIDGRLSDSHFKALTGEQCDNVAESIESRYGDEWAQRFDERALPLLSI
jgi:hypothetical protein